VGATPVAANVDNARMRRHVLRVPFGGVGQLGIGGQRVDNPPRPIAPPEITLDDSGTPAFRLPE